MTRTTLWLIALFALIAASCVAFGAYFSYVTLLNAHRSALEARFALTVERLVITAQRATSFGIALPAQTTLPEVLRRETEIERAISSIDVVDEHGVVLFSSDAARVGIAEPPAARGLSRQITNDIGATVGQVELRYDPAVLAAGAAALEQDLMVIAIPTLAAACIATIVIGLLLAMALKRAARRAAEPASWPPAARAAFLAVGEVHRGPSVERRGGPGGAEARP